MNELTHELQILESDFLNLQSNFIFICVVSIYDLCGHFHSLSQQVHAELEPPEPVSLDGLDPTKFSTFLLSRPRTMESTAIAMLLDIWKQKQVSSRLHIVHVADAESLPMISQAKQSGMNVTSETTPHNLYFIDTDVPDGSTAHKCKPPIRGAEDRDKIWEAVLDGTIDVIASDHAPYALEEKAIEEGDFLKAGAEEGHRYLPPEEDADHNDEGDCRGDCPRDVRRLLEREEQPLDD